MTEPIRYQVPLAPSAWQNEADFAKWDWSDVPRLSPFVFCDGSKLVVQQTTVRVCCDTTTLYVHFQCEDEEPWGTFTERDEPLYKEEIVEVVLSPGVQTPIDYFEFEVSPNGVLLDCKVHNPSGCDALCEVDTSWNCEGLRWYAERQDEKHFWRAVLVIPWASLCGNNIPRMWRGNFYRIDRPSNAPAEFTAWAPTFSTEPDFHIPTWFGLLQLDDKPSA
jgi:hypothetical protein